MESTDDEILKIIGPIVTEIMPMKQLEQWAEDPLDFRDFGIPAIKKALIAVYKKGFSDRRLS